MDKYVKFELVELPTEALDVVSGGEGNGFDPHGGSDIGWGIDPNG